MSAAEPYRPLAGVRIVTLEQAVALPMATRLLADLGAEVVRVESHARATARGRYLGNDLVRNKRGLAIDLRREEGRRVMRRLVLCADVFCENFTPRVKQQFGLAYEALSAEKPELIMLSLSGYGQTGAWAQRPTYGPGIEAAAGHAQSMGYPDQPPTRPGTIVYADNISGFYATLALLGALHRRRLTGRGRYIDLSMYEANAFHLGPSLVQTSLGGRPVERRGNDDPEALLQGVYASRESERWVAVTVRPSDADALDAVLGSRAAPADRTPALSDWVAARDASEAAGTLQRAGIAASVVLNARDLHTNEQLRVRDAFTPVRHEAPVNGYAAHPHAASPWRFVGHPRPPLQEAPATGQDSRAVLAGWLGLSEQEIDALVDCGAVGVAATTAQPANAILPVEQARKRLEWRLIAGYDPDPGETLDLPRAE